MSGPGRLHQVRPFSSIWLLPTLRTRVMSGPPHPPGQNGGVAQAIEHVEKSRAIEVRFDKPSVRASSFELLHDTPQSADLPQVAETPQNADVSQNADISQDADPTGTDTPQNADTPGELGVFRSSSQKGLTPQNAQIRRAKGLSSYPPDIAWGQPATERSNPSR